MNLKCDNEMEMPFHIHETESRSILSATSGFIREAGFTHSLTPARNCTFGCSYCYVPTMGLYGGLKPDDWNHWGHFTTFKSNAAELLRKALRPDQRIYCSPLVDPYQPAEADQLSMPEILNAVIHSPPALFVIQTRSPLVLRDLPQIRTLATLTKLRVSFSLTTDCEDIRRIFEPHCAPIGERLEAIGELRAAGIETTAALAPLLPCDPERLAAIALAATSGFVIADPLHVRATKSHGATTRDAAVQIAARHGHSRWLQPAFQAQVLARIDNVVRQAGRRFAAGTEGFGWLTLERS